MARSRFAVAVIALALAGCGSNSNWTPPPLPTAPEFSVVSLDMQFGAPQAPPPTGLCDPSHYTPFQMYQNGCRSTTPFIAHGVFRNNGAPGSATVTFTAPDLGRSCRANLRSTPTGGTAEGFCLLGELLLAPTPSTLTAAFQSS